MADSPFLLTPGPVPVPPEVLAIQGEPQMHHRSAAFVATYGEVLRKLKLVYRTENDVLLFTASGTGAFESVFANTVEAGDRVLCVTAGAFGNRWVSMARAFGADVVALEGEWGRPPDPAEVAAAMADESLQLAVVVHSETSTATVTDIQEIGELSRGRKCLLAIDAVSSLGAVPIETDGWGLDVVVSGTQKGMSTPPGLSFASVSPAAWERSRETDDPALLLRLEAHARRPERRWQPVHARDLDRAARSTWRSTACSARASRRSGSARRPWRAASARACSPRASSSTRPTTRRARS